MTQNATPIFVHIHSKIIKVTFRFPEFVPENKKSVYFIDPFEPEHIKMCEIMAAITAI